MTGRVRIAGSTPLEQILIGDAATSGELEVRGEYRAELRNLMGATVRAHGVLRDEKTLVVSEYEIIEIAGRAPTVGVLVMDDDAYWLRSGDDEDIELAGAPTEFDELIGATVWVFLDENGAVEAYGVIRKG